MNDCPVDPADMAIIRGNNYPPMIWQFLSSENPDVLFDITGSIFKLTILLTPGSPLIVKSSDVDAELVMDTVASTLTWNYTVAQSRLLPLGKSGRYELERWIGATQQTWIKGAVVVSAGDNPD